MSWTDKSSIEVIKKLRDIFDVDVFIETGTWLGINAEVYSNIFKQVLTVEKDDEYYKKAKKRLRKYENISKFYDNSARFLKWLFKNDRLRFYTHHIPLIYLDAHFYDKTRPKGKGKFVVLDELKALKNKECVIIIHDFCNGLGGINYDGIDLDFDLLKPYLKKVNPNFYYYTNSLKSCDILNPEEVKDKDMKEALKYVWSKPEKTYRGILYAVPREINIEGLKEIK